MPIAHCYFRMLFQRYRPINYTLSCTCRRTSALETHFSSRKHSFYRLRSAGDYKETTIVCAADTFILSATRYFFVLLLGHNVARAAPSNSVSFDRQFGTPLVTRITVVHTAPHSSRGTYAKFLKVKCEFSLHDTRENVASYKKLQHNRKRAKH